MPHGYGSETCGDVAQKPSDTFLGMIGHESLEVPFVWSIFGSIHLFGVFAREYQEIRK